MLYGILVTLFTLMCLFLVLIILIQKGKSSIGLGSLGGGSQLLFGGSGGQDIFQKITWVMGILFMTGSLILALMKKPTTSEILQKLSKQIASEHKAIEVPQAQAPAKNKAEETKSSGIPA